MTASQSSERVPNANRAFLSPSAESCPQKFEGSRCRPEFLRSLGFALIVSIWAVLSYRASFNNFALLVPASGSWAGALTAIMPS
jgi:hypothetical protein